MEIGTEMSVCVWMNQTVEVKVKMDCEGCERKVKKAVEGMKGVNQVDVDRKANKVTVVGYVEASKVVARIAHRTGKKAELWPYVPYDVVEHPYAPGVYDKKAPSGYVRNTDDPHYSHLARASSTEVRYTTAFSDENPSACVVMWRPFFCPNFSILLYLSAATIIVLDFIVYYYFGFQNLCSINVFHDISIILFSLSIC